MLSERRSGLAESIWRAGFGAWLFVYFATCVWPAEGSMRPVGAFGMLAALLMACGRRERFAAALLVLFWWLRPLALVSWSGDWIVLALLLTQVALPPAPYGSLAARGRADPSGGWSMPGSILRIRFAALFAFGLCGMFAPEPSPGFVLACAAAAVFARYAPERAFGWAWLAFFVAAIATSFGFGQQNSRELLWLALAANFQPGWFPAKSARGVEWIFYDGTCALCHGFVRFVLAEDMRGECFRFAPLAALPESERAQLPDSIVVRRQDGRTLLRSAAVLHVMRRLGGWWRLVAEVVRFVPPPLRDLAYSCVAALRKRVFGTELQACPMLPRHLRARFGG